MRPRRALGTLFKTIVAGLSACGTDDHVVPDASLADASDASFEASAFDVVSEGAPLDSYVDWCEAGPPELVYDGGCYDYEYIPCGLPAGDTVNDAGVINRCDQVCAGSDDCVVLPPLWIGVLLDAGVIDGGTAATVADGGAVFVLCACLTSGGRRPEGLRSPSIRARNALGAYFSHMAHLERASITAFERLRAELDALGAPKALLQSALRARRDEELHARLIDGVAARFGGARVLPRVRRYRAGRSAERIARENLVEGCVRETYGALLATWQARHARDAHVRRVIGRIAQDETRHAELSWTVHRFLDRKLDSRARRRIALASERSIAALRLEASSAVDALLVSRAGMPNHTQARALVDALDAAVWRS